MAVFLARWPNGDCAIVMARNRNEAYIQLDEIGDEPAMLWQMPICLISFVLTDRGSIELEWFGQETMEFIRENCYPGLAALDWDVDPTVRKRGRVPSHVKNAVAAERSRHAEYQGSKATTQAGAQLQSRICASGRFADCVVLVRRRAAAKV